MEPLENKNNKFVAKYNVLLEIVDFVAQAYSGYDGVVSVRHKGDCKSATMLYDIIYQGTDDDIAKRLSDLRLECVDIIWSYNIGVAPSLLRYSEDKSDEAYYNYDEYIITENIIGRMTDVYNTIEDIVAVLLNHSGFKKHIGTTSFKETLNKYRDTYSSLVVKIDAAKKDICICPTCQIKMAVHAELSELRCPQCAVVIHLEGAVFEDAQIHIQQTTIKSKEYDPNKHCDKWIKCIQGKEDRNIPAYVINKIDAKAIAHYSRGDRLLPMNNMTCKMIREWLKNECGENGRKLTCYNNDSALIRKIVTSLHGDAVVPPQLLYDEEEKLLLDFSRAMAEYDNIVTDPKAMEKIGIRGRSNKPYYPYGLFKILRIRYLSALDRKEEIKYKKLIECIHVQSDDTLVDNDLIWKEICNRIPDFKYEFTDRNFLVECIGLYN